jgi:hypothetical protein
MNGVFPDEQPSRPDRHHHRVGDGAGAMRHAALDYPESPNTHRRTTLKNGLILAGVGMIVCVVVGRLFAPPVKTMSAPTIEQLKPLAELMTHRVVVTDALTVSLSGYTGDLRAAVIVRGDAIITVDLTEARIEDVDQQARTAVIVLPPPKVVSARVDHDHTYVFSIESSGLWGCCRPMMAGPS